MSLNVSVLRHRVRVGAIAALAGLLSAGLHAEGAPAAAATASSASAPAAAASAANEAAIAAANEAAKAASAALAAAPAPSAKIYAGRFESGCVNMFEHTLSFVDVFVLKPVNAKTLSVEMKKSFFSGDDCAPATAIGQVIVPTGKWQLDGKAFVGGRLVDQVTVMLPAGEIKVTGKPGPKGKGKIVSEGDSINVHYGEKENFSVGKMSAEGKDKDLRWLDKGKLFFGTPEKVGADGYPLAINDEIYFSRK